MEWPRLGAAFFGQADFGVGKFGHGLDFTRREGAGTGGVDQAGGVGVGRWGLFYLHSHRIKKEDVISRLGLEG